MDLDPETTTFLTAMRDSIESKIETGNREGREAVSRVESKLSELSREVGEQTMALANHKDEDDRQFKDHAEDIESIRQEAREDTRTRMQKATPAIQGTTAAGLFIAFAEWLRSGGPPS